MNTYSTSDLSRKAGDVIADAMRRPVTIIQRNKPRLVLLSIEDYRRLIERADTRTAGTLGSMCCSPQKSGHFSRCCLGRDELAG